MEFTSIKPTERVIDILHPATGEETGVKVTILSMIDERMKKVQRRIHDHNLSLERKGKNLKSVDVENNINELLVSAMTDWVWEGDAKFHGEKPDFNRANVLKVFDELPWFKRQVSEAIEDEQGFFAS